MGNFKKESDKFIHLEEKMGHVISKKPVACIKEQGGVYK